MQLFSTITLADIADGAPGGTGASVSNYDLVFNKEQIIKYKTHDAQTKEYTTVMSPEELTFYLVNRTEEPVQEKVDINDYGFSISASNVMENSGIASTSNQLFSFLSIEEFFQYGIETLFPFLYSVENSKWILNLKKIWEIQLRFQKYFGLVGREVFLVFHTQNSDTGFDPMLTWEDIPLNSTIFVGIYYPSEIKRNSDGSYSWEEKPAEYSKYSWYEYGLRIDEENPTQRLVEKALRVYTLGQILYSEQASLIFNSYKFNSDLEYYDINNVLINVEWASSESLATFSLKADGIVSAIDNSKLEFSRDGLSITNGGITISNEVNGQKETLLTFDESGDLIIKGKIYANDGIFKGRLEGASGTFSGSLEAATGTFKGDLEAATGTFIGELKAAFGSFSGDITATSGYIKDLIIGNKEKSHLRLYVIESEDGDYYGGIIHNAKTEDNIDISNFSVDLNGHIIANSITLNKGTIGDISFGNSIIESDTWSISPEVAVFNNIIAQGKITTAIFDQQNIQLCGGSFLFKDGIILEPIIISENVSQISIGPVEGLVENTLYLLTNENKTLSAFCNCELIYTEDVLEDVILHFVDTVKIGKYNLIINLGTITENQLQDWLIGINSTNTQLINSGLQSNSITLSAIEKVNLENGQYSYEVKPKIILGKIPSSIFPTETYGLYAESAFLSGTLTTQFQSDSGIRYAGVNTISGATFANNSNNLGGITLDNSRIVFWAGSEDTSSEKIQEANFQVTENGTLYAAQGIFTGSIITDATIQASTIYTARLSGKDNDGSALIIEDADIGIDFRDITGASAMLITTGQMALKMPIIFDSENYSQPNIQNAIIFGRKIGLADENGKSIVINPYSLDFYEEKIENENLINMRHGSYYFNIDNDILKLNYYHNNNENIIMSYEQDEEISIKCSLSSKDNVYLGRQEDKHYTAVYKPVIKVNTEEKQEMIGLDLFIEEFIIS